MLSFLVVERRLPLCLVGFLSGFRARKTMFPANFPFNLYHSHHDYVLE
jgi:hypothetical protein